MATPDLTSGTVMDSAAALLNDTAKTVYTYETQLPYLNMALNELQEEFERNEVPVTGKTSVVIEVDTDVEEISFTSTPALPTDLIEPSLLWERARDTNPFLPMNKLEELPLYMIGSQIPQLIYYTWKNQALHFLPANADNDIKLTYISALFTRFTSILGTDQVNVINAETFLEYRTAALCARFIGENATRADELNAYAVLGIDRALGIGAKGRQNIVIRRRPFRSGYKRRSYL